MSTPTELERQFLKTIFDWIVSLPHDLKVLFEAKDEPNLEREAREIACGAILYVLTPETSGGEDFVAFADDAMVLREALRAVRDKGGEAARDFRERFVEYYDTLDGDLGTCEKVMGDAYSWLASKIDGLKRMVYKGKKVALYVEDDEAGQLLYDAGLAFATDYPIQEGKLAMRLKKVETLLDPLRRKAAEERKKIA